MKKRIYRIGALLGAFIFLLPALACINDYRPFSPVHHFDGKDAIRELKRILKRDRVAEAEQLREAQKRALERKAENSEEWVDFRMNMESDLATSYLRLGETAQGLAMLERLIQEYPKEYNLNANLGTAYELAGQNEQALAYLKKALDINKRSHRGSEWIHVKILEAKIALKQNPDWLKTNDILGKELEQIFRKNKKEELETLLFELGYQLFERVHFIAPKDAIMGDLIMELGNMYAALKDMDSANESYRLAEEYTVSVPEKLQKAKEKVKLIAAAKKRLAEAEKAHNARNRRLYWAALVLGVVVVGSWLAYYKRNA